jgi:hypothetical protein
MLVNLKRFKRSKEKKMKKSIAIATGLILAGCYFMTADLCSYEGVTLKEVSSLMGACTQDAIGPTDKVCYGGCSAGGCGCINKMPWNDDGTCGHPSDATACGTDYHCTAPQTIEDGACDI